MFLRTRRNKEEPTRSEREKRAGRKMGLGKGGRWGIVPRHENRFAGLLLFPWNVKKKYMLMVYRLCLPQMGRRCQRQSFEDMGWWVSA